MERLADGDPKMTPGAHVGLPEIYVLPAAPSQAHYACECSKEHAGVFE